MIKTIRTYMKNQKGVGQIKNELNVKINDRVNFMNGTLYQSMGGKPKPYLYLFNLGKLIQNHRDIFRNQYLYTGKKVILGIYDNEINCFIERK